MGTSLASALVKSCSVYSLVGAVATASVAAALALGRNKAPFKPCWQSWAAAVAGLGAMLLLVTSEVRRVKSLAGGLPVPDVVYPYNASYVLEFAQALGADGRAQYAAFQLGVDTLAPPAFTFFTGLALSAAALPWALHALATALLVSYFVSVLLANGLMPVVMLSYPDIGAQPGAGLLLELVPWLDFLKYSLHASVWVVILAALAVRLLLASGAAARIKSD